MNYDQEKRKNLRRVQVVVVCEAIEELKIFSSTTTTTTPATLITTEA